MRVKEYLEARGESQAAFAKRATEYLEAGVSQRTVSRAAAGEGVHAVNAWAMIEASKAEPAPDGGTVTLEDFVLEDAAA